MTSILIADTPLRGECQVDVTDEILGETPSLGNFFSAATPPSNPSPVDDALAIARFDDWLFSEHSPEAVGDECFPTAVAVATILREQGISEPVAQDRVERWSLFACSPQLEQAELDLAVRDAYSRPLIVSAVRPAQPGAQAPPTPLQPGASGVVETAEQARAPEPDSASPPQPAPQAKPDNLAAHEVLVIEADTSRGAKETLQKLLDRGKDCPIPPTTVAQRGNVRRFVYSLPPNTRVENRTIGPGITVMGCSESAAFEGYEIVKDLPRVPPAKSVFNLYTLPVSSKAADENIPVA